MNGCIWPKIEVRRWLFSVTHLLLCLQMESNFALSIDVPTSHTKMQFPVQNLHVTVMERILPISLSLTDNYSSDYYAKKKLWEVKTLEDYRLKQCEENGKHWEQCFFYGTEPISSVNEQDKSKTTVKRREFDAAFAKPNPVNPFGAFMGSSGEESKRMRPPTW